jgi:dihydropteroate synthase-like protein
MKVVIVTGKLIENRAREIAEKFKHDVLIAPVDIASFIKTQHLKNIEGYDLILVPGYSNPDLNLIEKITGIETVKGPKNIANLSIVLQNLESLKLSKTTPACEMLQKRIKHEANAELKLFESSKIKRRFLKKTCNISVGDLAVGRDFPMRVLAEIVDADKMDDEAVLSRAKYYMDAGADIIDIGISKKAPSKVGELIKALRVLNVPLSVDSMELENISAALEAKADLILSLDKELIKRIPPTDTTVVIIPGKRRYNSSKERLSSLIANISLAKEKGFSKIIADPILEPIGSGLSASIHSYKELYDKSKIPSLMGVGNVTELTDADSIGINATLSGIAMECGISILFTTEASDKTRGCVKELKIASQMMFLAKHKQTPPKDLGLDLLKYKEKTRLIDEPLIKTKRIMARQDKKTRNVDTLGDFTILVFDKTIFAIHSKEGHPDLTIEGNNAREISETILRLGLFSELSHALYLGRELAKAEIAIQTDKSYIQDEPLFDI